MWGATTRMCQTIAAEFARHDTPVLFVILPTAYQVSGSDFEDYVAMFDIDTGTVDIRLPNTILGSRFTDTSLDYVDVLDTLRRASVISGERTHGAVDHHLSPYGHRVVAEAIAGRAAAILSNAGRSR